MSPTGRAGAALFGKVAIEGEALPWEPILVTVNCDGNTVYTTQTDSKGEFGVFPTQVKGEISQQGDAQRQMQVHYEGCAIQGFLTGFHSSKTIISVKHLRDDPNVGTISLSRDSAAKSTAMSKTIQTAPSEALKLWAKAGEYMISQKPEKAQGSLEKAVKEYPAFADAWFQLGNLHAMSSPPDARTFYEKALQADPTFVLPYDRLAALDVQQEDWQGASNDTLKSLELDPSGTARIWYFSALANYQLGRLKAAQYSGEKLMTADPLHNIRNGEQLLAAILARQADFAGALAHLRNALTYTPAGPDADLLQQEIAQLEKRAAASSN
jgi:tetratricopeptide (TPR) repeat protein